MGDPDWTLDTLYEHLQRQLNDLAHMLDERRLYQERAVETALSAAKEAVSKAEVATEKRFDAVNEFRGQMADQAAMFLPREEYKTAHEALIEKMSTANETRVREITELDKRLTTALHTLSSRLDLNQGQDTGQAAGLQRVMSVRGQLIATAGVIIAALAIVTSIIITTR